MKLTREEAILWHRKMWNWIADRIEEEKEYQDINYLKKEYCDIKGFHCETNNCFCCEYTNINCSLCPIEWGSEVNILCVLISIKNMTMKDCICYVVMKKIGKNRQN